MRRISMTMTMLGMTLGGLTPQIARANDDPGSHMDAELGTASDPCPNDPGNDADGDGVCGDVDNCPHTANPEQLDADGDGIGDRCQMACVSVTQRLAVSESAQIWVRRASVGQFRLARNSTFIGDLNAAGDGVLSKAATIQGTLNHGGELVAHASASITGGVSTRSTEAPAQPVSSFSHGARNIEVVPGQSLTLSPGAYRDVVVRDTGRLTLNPGVYHLRRLAITGGGRLELAADATTAPVRVFTDVQFFVGNKATAGTPQDSDSFIVTSRQTADLRLGFESEVHAHIHAPRARVTMAPRSNLSGCIYADRLRLGRRAEIDGSDPKAPSSCDAGLDCSGSCVDPQADWRYCGASGTCTDAAAGTRCEDGTVCSQGACIPVCDPGMIVCGGHCVDPQSDGQFCGATADCQADHAGRTCAEHEMCSAGMCTGRPCAWGTSSWGSCTWNENNE